MFPSSPQTRPDSLVEVLHGHEVADPYRWLEDPDSEETAEWVQAQRRHCDEVLSRLDYRAWFSDVMARITSRPRSGAPWQRAGLYLVERNDGHRNQDVVYAADSLGELLAGGRVLVDPNTWSNDGSASLACLEVNPQGSLLAVGRSVAGSDWTHVSLVDRDGNPVPDAEVVTKFCRPVWLPDGRSYLYNAFPGAGRAEGTESRAQPPAHVMVHRVGEPTSADVELFGFDDEPQAGAWCQLSDDERWLVVHVGLGTERSKRVWLYPITERDGSSVLGRRVEVIDRASAAWNYVGSAHGLLYFRTDDDAPRGRLVSIDPETWSLATVVPQTSATLRQAVLAGDVLVVEHLADASPRLRRHGLDGSLLGEVELPGGAVAALHARADSPEVNVAMSTLCEPSVVWRLDATTGELRRLDELCPGQDGWQAPGYRVERRRAPSTDGARVPYFLVVPDGVDLAQPQPTLLYGYGGFDIPVLADFRATWPGWLAAGGVLVIANLRGGGEFGREWYDDGRRERKQHVFDDVLAVAEQLVADGVTTPGQLAVHGKSNGGLLVGAAITQRPDLFAAALPHVGVLDAVRFARFTVGAAWASDYGNPDEAADLERILAWSPLHNITPGTRYPATLVMTSDHDDRVVPAHSYKFGAALQAAQADADAPVAVRIEPATGHGLANKPPQVLAAEAADLLAFAAHFTGLHPGSRAPRR